MSSGAAKCHYYHHVVETHESARGIYCIIRIPMTGLIYKGSSPFSSPLYSNCTYTLHTYIHTYILGMPPDRTERRLPLPRPYPAPPPAVPCPSKEPSPPIKDVHYYKSLAMTNQRDHAAGPTCRLSETIY